MVILMDMDTTAMAIAVTLDTAVTVVITHTMVMIITATMDTVAMTTVAMVATFIIKKVVDVNWTEFVLGLRVFYIVSSTHKGNPCIQA